jgi:signal transduction histidine kinase
LLGPAFGYPSDMTLRARLALGLLAIAAVLLLPLLFSLRSLNGLQGNMRELRRVEFSASLALGRLREATDEVRRSELATYIAYDSLGEPRLERAVDSLNIAVDSLRSVWPAGPLQPIVRRADDIANFAPVELALVRERRLDQADTLRTTGMLPAIEKLEWSIAEAERVLRLQTETRVNATADHTYQAFEFATSSALAALLLATLIAVWLTRTISRPVRDLERGMEAVANGEFGHELQIAPNRHDEFGRLAVSYQSMATQLAELDKLKAEFVSVASHELKTPLNVILGYLSLLEDGVYGNLSAKQREVLATIGSQCQALARLVKQLLDVSRFEAGGGKLEPRAIDLVSFFDELEDAFQVLASQRGVTFEVSLSPELPAEVVWDADRINEVLGNLVSNAFKFTDRYGRVELTVEPVNGSVVMEVRDTGAGIPPAQLPHIFEKFYQADNQTAASAKGTGLGLAIAREIVDAHHGSITVDSTPGIGTVFTITLPVQVVPGRRSTPAQLVTEGAA